MQAISDAPLWIDGRAMPAQGGEDFPVLDPGTGEVLGHAARGGAADVDQAVDAANGAFRSPAWHDIDPFQRGRLMLAWASKVEEQGEMLARLLSLENGKPLRDARDEIQVIIRNLEYYGGWADKSDGRVLRVPGNVLDYLLHEPLGTVGHIIPWNYPLDIFARGVAPCLAVGNTVVVKPAEETPLSAVALARLASEAGLPDGVVNVVTGLGAEAGTALASHAGIQGLAFCGSVETGREVLLATAPHITPVLSLELGGKSPCLIFSDADVQRAAESAARGICFNTGQSCGALSRVLVPKEMAAQVADIIATTLATVQLGHGLDDPDMGPLVSAAQLEKVTGYIETGCKEGARLLFGGQRPSDEKLLKGFFIQPAAFTNAQMGMKIVEEEIFGPVLAILTFEDEEQAVELANRSAYGLSAEIWTRDLSRAHRIAAQLNVSHVTVNGGGGFGIEAPFGGVKQSGFGREGGWESILQYSRVKNVWINL
jgi:acyl-CoA reductase-like NAD-dependent aldehyde dehydrogenase